MLTPAPIVLIVDDSPSNLELLMGELGDVFDLRVASNGADALQGISKGLRPDLILLDIVMPELDGYQVFSALRALEATAEVPVIFLSARDSEEDESRGLALGAVDYISKPFSPPLVRKRIETHLKLYRQQQLLQDQVVTHQEQSRQATAMASQHQASLQQSDRLYRELFNNISSGVGLYRPTPDGRDFIISELNPAACAATGADSDRIRGELLSETFPGTKAIGLLDAMHRVSRSGVAENLGERLYQDGQRRLWVENYLCRLPEGQVAVIFNDITERKEREQALQRAKLQWEKTFHGISDLIILFDEQLRVLQVNRAAAHFFARSGQNLQGLSCSQLLGGREVPCAACPLVDSEGHLCEVDGQLHEMPLGKTIEFSSSLLPSAEPNGQQLVMVARDVTGREQLRRRNERHNRLAAIGELAAGIAHEINNPNGLILFNSDLLRPLVSELVAELQRPEGDLDRHLLCGHSSREILELLPDIGQDIHDAAGRIKKIVMELRQFSGNDQNDKQSPVDLNQVVKISLNLVGYRLDQLCQQIVCELADDLPQIIGVTTQIEQVVVNLLLNAAQALEHPEQRIQIATFVDRERGQVVLEVRDQGCGMDENLLAQAFEAFVTTRRNQAGTGLGLSVADQIVRQHGGTIDLESTPGEGTLATVRLPIASEAAHAD